MPICSCCLGKFECCRTRESCLVIALKRVDRVKKTIPHTKKQSGRDKGGLPGHMVDTGHPPG